MEKIVIHGGRPLKGEVEISGGKNAAVAIIPAAILVEGVCRVENIPQIRDVSLIIDILYRMGAAIRTINKTTLEIDCSHMHIATAPSELSRKMRASYYLLGALLGRFSQAQVDLPGGCDFGVRPIDQHVKGFEALGAKVMIEHGIVYSNAKQLKGNYIYLDIVSVGATINIMLSAVRAKGQTVIENAAKEPHIVDVANFLNSMGADVKGAGTDVIKINGVDRLHGGVYTIIPDQIEAGTYMAAAAITNGEVRIKNIIPKHLESISAKLSEIGADVIEEDDSILVRGSSRLNKANIKTLPYPGFPTDMQPQMASLLSIAEGTSIITEGVWDNRFRYVDELKRMGANIQVDGKIAVIEGSRLSGASVKACDLRAGAAMVIAGLAAKGTTTIEDIEQIERGYEDITDKLYNLGADIKKVTTPDNPAIDKAI